MRFWGLVGILLVGVFAFLVGQRLSADAVGMAMGVLFGVLAGIPAALLVLASGRRRQEAEFDAEEEDDVELYGGRRGRRQSAYGALPSQAPVIIFAPPSGQAPPIADAAYHYTSANGHAAPPQRALPGPAPRTVDGGRSFKVVGEQEEWITEW